MSIDCVIFDLDGTISDPSKRLPLLRETPIPWDAFSSRCHEDTVISQTRAIYVSLYTMGLRMMLSTGRPEVVRAKTHNWFDKEIGTPYTELYMRADGDYRSNAVVKGEHLDRMLEAGYNPVMAFEDNRQVVDMFVSRGIPTYHMVFPGYPADIT